MITLDVRDGFGKHEIDIIAEHGVEALTRIGMRDDIVGFLVPFAMAWSKTSFAVTLLNIDKGRIRLVIWAIIISTNLLLVMAAFSFLFQCSPVEKLWNPRVPGTCWPDMNRVLSMLASAYSGFMDFVLALLPVRRLSSTTLTLLGLHRLYRSRKTFNYRELLTDSSKLVDIHLEAESQA